MTDQKKYQPLLDVENVMRILNKISIEGICCDMGVSFEGRLSR